MTKVSQIKLSLAALIRENAFRDVLHKSNEEVKAVSGSQKLERYCDKFSLGDVLDYIRTDGKRGLPSLSPPRKILADVINSIGLGSTVSELDTIISDNAFYEKPD